MFLLALRDACWLTLLAFPLIGFDLVQKYGETGKEIIFEWQAIGTIFIGILLIRLAAGFFKRYRIYRCPEGRLQEAKLGISNIVSKVYRLFDHRLHQRPALVTLFALAVALPFLPRVSNAALDVLTLAFIYVVLGLGLNIVVGLAGLLDLGYVGFYAVGAYGYGLLYQYWGWSFWQALPACGMIAALFGVVLGFPVLRLRGDYLAIVTLGFGEIIRIILNNWDSFTNGPNGISSIPRPTLMGLEFSRQAKEGATTFHDFLNIEYSSNHKQIFMYLLLLSMAVFTMFVVERLQHSRLGRAWIAMREDETACAAMGINTTLAKLSAFAKLTIGRTPGNTGIFIPAACTLSRKR